MIWIHASSVSRIDQAYKEIAGRAHLPGLDDPKRNKVALVADWLSQDENGEWHEFMKARYDMTMVEFMEVCTAFRGIQAGVRYAECFRRSMTYPASYSRVLP